MSKADGKSFSLKKFLKLFIVLLLLLFLVKTIYSWIFPSSFFALNYNDQINNEALRKYLGYSLSLTMQPLYNQLQFKTHNPLQIPTTISIRTEDIKTDIRQGFHWTLRDLPERPQLDLICVVDTSGSMSGQKIEFVKQSLIEMLEFLADGDRISIVIFYNSPTVIAELIKVENNREDLIKKINDLSAFGGTNIYEGMYKAFSILSERNMKAQITSIFLLTDGLDNFSQGENLINKINSIYYNKEISANIYTFGYGNDHDSKFLGPFAQKNGGEYYYIENIENIRKYFINAFGQILSIAFQKTEINVIITDQAQNIFENQLKIYQTYGSMWEKVNNSLMIKLDQLQYGVAKDFVFELEIPFIPDEQIQIINDIELFSIKIYTQNIQEGKLEKTFSIKLKFIKSSIDLDNKINLKQHVLINYYRMKLVKNFENVQKLIVEKKQSEATKILEEFKIQLNNLNKDLNLPDLKEIIDEIENAIKKQAQQGAEHYFKKETIRRESQTYHPDCLMNINEPLNNIQAYMNEL